MIYYILTSGFNKAEALINHNQSQCDCGYMVVETNFKAGNSIKILFLKKGIDQIRFSMKKNLVWNISEVFFTTTLEVYHG